jgi:hypothetical protein
MFASFWPLLLSFTAPQLLLLVVSITLWLLQ